MNLKIISLIITLITLLIAELLSYINSCIWDINSSSYPSYPEKYLKKRLNTLYLFIGKISTALYFLFLILIVATFVIFILN